VWGVQIGLTLAGVESPALRLAILVPTGVVSFASLAIRELAWARQEWLQRPAGDR
jgi:hypothetical protein